MKQLTKYIIGLAVAAGFFISCKDDEQPVAGFSLDQEEVTFSDPNGGIVSVNLSTDAEWQATSEASWIQIRPGNGVGSAVVELKADSSVSASMRETQVRFLAKGAGMKNLVVKQFGYQKEIVLGQTEEQIESNAPYEERFFEVKVTANVNFKVEIPGDVNWLEFDKDQHIDLDYGERPRTGKLRFDWKINTKEEDRIAEIRFVPEQSKEGSEVAPVVLKVVQKSAPILTDDHAGDSLAVLTIYESMNGVFGWDASENMRNWKNVTLWKATDKIDGKAVPAEMVGRIRSASFNLFDTKESIPYQVTQLRFAERLVFYSNANRDLKKISLGPEICMLLEGHPKNPMAKDGGHVSYLKVLNLDAYGLVSLPEGFRSDYLEVLELSSNNFTDSKWLTYITKKNFPKLKSLQLTNMRMKSTVSDLSGKDLGFRWETGFGNNGQPYNPQNNTEFFKNELLKWDSLESLSLSVGLLEGELPGDEELQQPPYNFASYSEADFTEASDTLSDAKDFLINHKVTKVWPKMKALSLNLNFLTGKIPNWLLYHPWLDAWNPYALIFSQELKGKNSKKESVGFKGGEPKSLRDYSNLTPDLGYDSFVSTNSYYQVYPKMDPNYKPKLK